MGGGGAAIGGRDAIGTGPGELLADPGELLADPGPLLELLLASIDRSICRRRYAICSDFRITWSSIL